MQKGNVWLQFLKKLKTQPYDPLLGLYPKSASHLLTAALFTIATQQNQHSRNSQATESA